MKKKNLIILISAICTIFSFIIPIEAASHNIDLLRVPMHRDSNRKQREYMVLDVASGSGDGTWGSNSSHENIQQEVMKRLPPDKTEHGIHIIGIDNDGAEVRAGRRYGYDIRTVNARARKGLPFKPESFDLVTCYNFDDARFIRAIMPNVIRLLTMDGQIWIAPYLDGYYDISKNPGLLSMIPPVEEILRSKGFSVTTEIGLGYILICGKRIPESCL